jgi:hypothetical protein
MMEKANSTMVYCKYFVNVTMYPQYNNMIIKNVKKKTLGSEEDIEGRFEISHFVSTRDFVFNVI